MAENEEELKSFLMKVKEESKSWLKAKITASGPITSWETDGETVETVSDLIFGAPKSLQMVNAAMKLKDAYCLEWINISWYICKVKCHTVMKITCKCISNMDGFHKHNARKNRQQ